MAAVYDTIMIFNLVGYSMVEEKEVTSNMEEKTKKQYIDAKIMRVVLRPPGEYCTICLYGPFCQRFIKEKRKGISDCRLE